MSLFTDNKAVEVDTDAFICDLRTDIETNVDLKSQEYCFDFYREQPMKSMGDTKPPHYEWLDEEWAVRVSDVSQSTESTLRGRQTLRTAGDEETEDLEEGGAAAVPALRTRRQPSD